MKLLWWVLIVFVRVDFVWFSCWVWRRCRFFVVFDTIHVQCSANQIHRFSNQIRSFVYQIDCRDRIFFNIVFFSTYSIKIYVYK